MITQEQHDAIVAELNERLINHRQGMGNKIVELRNALSILFQAYKGLADSGDAGHWRLEDTDAGKIAMAALGIKDDGTNPLPKPFAFDSDKYERVIVWHPKVVKRETDGEEAVVIPSPFQETGPEHICRNRSCHVKVQHVMNEHPLCIYRRGQLEPYIFEAHGLEWYRHTPGDPMPCPDNKRISVLLRGHGIDRSWNEAAAYMWKKFAEPFNDCEIIGWRPADAPAKLPKEEPQC